MNTITDKMLTGQLTETLNHFCDAHVPVTITHEQTFRTSTCSM
ncbi:MAG: hypothetical protein AAGG51_19145 [Cyanobacteria bacterium P01_G01_bin.54]